MLETRIASSSSGTDPVGTANQITATGTAPATLSIPADFRPPGTVLLPVTAAGELNIGTPNVSLAGGRVFGQWTDSNNSSAEFDLQNSNVGTAASTDFIVNNDQATASTHYGNFGINSSGYTGTGSLNIAGATYLYAANGDLVLGTLTANGIHLLVNNGTTDAIAVSSTGAITLNGATSIASASFGLSGNISQAAWTTNGVRYKNVPATLTDTTSSGTVANASTDVFGGNTIAASSAVTFTKYSTMRIPAPIAGTNVTFTNAWAADIDSLTVGTSNPFTVSATGAVSAANAITGTSASASALAVGLTGATNPAFSVDASTSSQVAGLKVTGAATGGTVALAATDSGSNTNLTINAKGSGTIGIGSVSIGAVTIAPATTIGASLTVQGNISASAAGVFSWNTRGTISSPAFGSTQFGPADTDLGGGAQTLRFQGPSVGGTSNVAGPNATILGTLGKGSANSGDIIFQTGGAVGASGTTIATATESLRIKGVTGAVTIASGKSLVLGNAAVTGLTAGVLSATTNATIVIIDSTGQAYRIPCII